MPNIRSPVGVMEVVSMVCKHDTCIVMPTLGHALSEWRVYTTALQDLHDLGWMVQTRTAAVSRKTKTVLRLWVPYEPEPTMPLDFKFNRRGFDFCSTWFTRKELVRLVT